MQYRREIDGLRAVAILPVILFHGGIVGFSGGYVGVDVFFVISGYLITSIILEEIKKDQFSIIGFYERRARRILPALCAVVLFTTIAAFLLLPADALKSYSQSLVSVASFSSNIFFYMTSGYFSGASEKKPLLHTWSLAVEEQYYLIFPVLIIALWFLGKKRITLVIALISVASLSFSQYLSQINAVDANFYLIFSRAWELLSGSLIAFLKPHSQTMKKREKESAGIAGLLLIFYSILFFDNKTPFPSLYALIPVMGAVAIIAFTDADTYIGRFLGNKIFVGIGLISYSLYLWHQPLFAFLRLKTIGEPEPKIFMAAIITTFLLAYLSYRFVEKPFRNRVTVSKASIFRYSGLSLAVMLLVGLSGHIGNGFEKRFAGNEYVETIEFSPKRDECHTSGNNYLKPSESCRYFGTNVTWAAFGDSHIVEPGFALAKLLEKDGTGLLHLTFSGCPPALLFDAKRPGCSQWIKESLTYLENNESIENVLLGFRYSIYFKTELPELPHKSARKYVMTKSADNSGNAVLESFQETYWKSLSEIIERLLKAGKNVYLLYPIPELPVHIGSAITPFSVFSDKPIIDIERSISSQQYFNQNGFILNKLNTLHYGNKLYAIKPFDILGNGEYSPAVSNNRALYFDDNHLSISGANLLIMNSVVADHRRNKPTTDPNY